MAVIAFGGFTVAQPGDLAVIGALVGLVTVLVTVAAALGDLDTPRGVVDGPDAVARMAVGAV